MATEEYKNLKAYNMFIDPIFNRSELGGGGGSGLGQSFYLQSMAYKAPRNYYRKGGLKDEIPGILDLSSFRASKNFTINAAQERNTLAEKYTSDTRAYNESLLEQSRAQENFASRLLEQSERLSEAREGMPSSASQASSARMYGELSKTRMQNTARYLKELEAYKAPQAPEIDFSFRNPITGMKMNIDTRFEDVYEEQEVPSDISRRAIREDFASRRDAIMKDILEESASLYGKSEDFKIQPNSTYNQQYLNQFEQARKIERDAEAFAEAKALADMAGFEDFTVGGVKYDAVSAFYNQDTNKILADMIEKTTDRLGISQLARREDFMNEFNRRRERAISQQDAFNRQQEDNRKLAESTAAEKARVRKLFEAQKREYESTMSSFGNTPVTAGSGITFDDTRPM